MDDSKILDVIIENLKISDKHIIIRSKSGNIIYPKDLDSIKDIERLMQLKNNGRELYDNKTGNHYTRKTTIFYSNGEEYIFDLIENNNRLKKIEEKAKSDLLTGLLNKETILTTLDQFILNKHKEINSLGIVVCDIDRFKSINDTYGHLAGDEVLKTVSNELKELNCSNCQIGRFGGDEFVLLFKNLISDDLYNLMDKIRKKISHLKIEFENTLIDNVTMSFGIYSIDKLEQIDFSSFGQIIEERRKMFYNADEALYQSKQNGRNKVSIIKKEECQKSYIVSEEPQNNIIDFSEIRSAIKKA